MSCLYISEPGAKIRRTGRRLLVEKDESICLEIPVHRLQRLVLLGRTQLTADALALLLDRGVSVIMLTQNGRYRGELVGVMDQAAHLRRQQYLLSLDQDYCRRTSAALVVGKIISSRQVLRRYAANHPDTPIKAAIAELKSIADMAAQAPPLDSLRGYEGRAAAVYFDALREVFQNGPVPFDGRNRRPPKDPINALLSFTYILLTSWLESLVRASGLEPGIGFYHSDIRKAPVLALDLIELFRHLICDRMVMYVLHKRMVRPEQFTMLAGSCRLTDSARKEFLAQWDQWLHLPQRLLLHRDKISPLELLQLQLDAFTDNIKQGTVLHPLIMEA